MIALEFRETDVSFSTTEPPTWASAVDRWYQLDAPAFALAEAWSRWSDLPRPQFIVGASAGASNVSDKAFAETPRAQKFVHTLPSVRYAALCQVMRWAGPLLCVQRDPSTLVAGLAVATDFHEAAGETWVLGARAIAGGAKVELFRLGIATNSRFGLAQARASRGAIASDDEQLRRSLALRETVSLEGGWSLVPT